MACRSLSQMLSHQSTPRSRTAGNTQPHTCTCTRIHTHSHRHTQPPFLHSIPPPAHHTKHNPPLPPAGSLPSPLTSGAPRCQEAASREAADAVIRDDPRPGRWQGTRTPHSLFTQVTCMKTTPTHTTPHSTLIPEKSLTTHIHP